MKLKKIFQFIFRRVVIVALLLVVQIVALIVIQMRFSAQSTWFYAAFIFASLCAVFAILSNRSNPAYKIAWIVLIMTFPVFGGPFYLLFGFNKLSRHTRKKMAEISSNTRRFAAPNRTVNDELAEENPIASLQSPGTSNRERSVRSMTIPPANTMSSARSAGNGCWRNWKRRITISSLNTLSLNEEGCGIRSLKS